MKQTATLSEKRNDLTRSLIMDAALALLAGTSVSELTVRAVAAHASMSERTVFRYFASRDALLDAVAAQLLAQMDLPAPPETLEALLAAPRDLYRAFEARAELTKAALHTDLVQRVRMLQAGPRWAAVSALLASSAAGRSEAERRIAAANICFHLTASSWHYYRYSFSFSLEESIACAETAVRQALDAVHR
jgi:AcrR family transcriptional regulator